MDLTTIIPIIISVAALGITTIRWLSDVLIYENIEFHPAERYETNYDPVTPQRMYEVPLLFKNSGQHMGYVVLKEISCCSNFEPYFEFSVAFQRESARDPLGQMEEVDTEVIGAKSYQWAMLFVTRKIPKVASRTSPTGEPERVLLKSEPKPADLPELPIDVPLTLHYKSTTKKGFKEESVEFSLRISEKQTKSPIFRYDADA